MKKLMTIVAVLALMALVCANAMAAGTDNHSVTVTVNAISELNVGAAVVLTVDAAVAGSAPTAVTDTVTTLAWTTNEAAKKITVATTTAAAQKFTLTALAVEPTSQPGVPSGIVNLVSAASALDFISGVGASSGTDTITYTGSATAAQGTGSDVHTVVYTIVAE